MNGKLPKSRFCETQQAAAIIIGFLFCTSLLLAREQPPDPAPPKPFRPPAPAIVKLANGLSVVVVERRGLPLLTLNVVVRSGAESDPADLPGTAQLTAQVLTQGTKGRSARQISDTVDAMGAQLSSSGDWDHSEVDLTVLSDRSEEAFELLADIIRNPAFPAEEVERKRQQTISALDLLRDDPAYMADALFDVLAFQGTPYGRPLDGTVESVRRISRDDLTRFHSRHYQPQNCILALVGDISAEEAQARAGKYFGDWKGGGVRGAAVAPAPSPPVKRRLVVVDKPDAVQTEIRVGNHAIRRASPEYHSLTVANQVLGGPAVNRLFRQLRSRRGLAYGASSELHLRRAAGSWMAKTSTRTAETVPSLRAVLEETRRLRDDPGSARDLQMARSYLIGHLALEFETSAHVAEQTLELLIHELPLDTWNEYAVKVEQVQPGDISEAARKYLANGSEIIVLVGDARRFGKELRKIGPFETIPLPELDLASPTLRNPAR